MRAADQEQAELEVIFEALRPPRPFQPREDVRHGVLAARKAWHPDGSLRACAHPATRDRVEIEEAAQFYTGGRAYGLMWQDDWDLPENVVEVRCTWSALVPASDRPPMETSRHHPLEVRGHTLPPEVLAYQVDPAPLGTITATPVPFVFLPEMPSGMWEYRCTWKASR